ncbi:glycosyltransferase [Georgenia daeguensis]|uniref:4,4'-diaponeurosporenoate glycosyltransferase n=1 Tax=Georgenia daeguensis TaxID=908355 RepID=A0ABP8ESE7_9MICO
MRYDEDAPVQPHLGQSPTLSIVTVTFDNDEGLARTLSSLRFLRGIPFEVVVIDGASLQSTAELIAETGVEEITLIQEPDGGPYFAMNKGLDAASGAWIWFLNAGDEVAPQISPGRLVELFNEHKSSVLLGIALRPDATTAWQYNLGEVLRGYSAPCHQATIIDRALCNSRSFDTRYKVSADYDFLLSVAEEAPVAPIDMPLCLYEAGGMSERLRGRLELETLLIRLRHGIQPLRALPADILRVPWRALRNWRRRR